MSSLYENIAGLCAQKNISVYKLCTDLGMRNSVISDLKTGRKKGLNSETLSKIADYFGTPVDYILGNTPKEKTPAVTVYDEHDNVIRLDNETLELIDSLRTRPEMKMMFSVSKNATKEDIIKAIKIIEALKDESEGK